MDEDESNYYEIGAFAPRMAHDILGRMEEAEVRFLIERDDSAIKNLSPVQAIFGGTWGHGSVIRIYIHHEDEAKATGILSSFFEG